MWMPFIQWSWEIKEYPLKGQQRPWRYPRKEYAAYIIHEIVFMRSSMTNGIQNVPLLVRSVIECLLHKPFWTDFSKFLWDSWTSRNYGWNSDLYILVWSRDQRTIQGMGTEKFSSPKKFKRQKPTSIVLEPLFWDNNAILLVDRLLDTCSAFCAQNTLTSLCISHIRPILSLLKRPSTLYWHKCNTHLEAPSSVSITN
jgi:hypothetical protein